MKRGISKQLFGSTSRSSHFVIKDFVLNAVICSAV